MTSILVTGGTGQVGLELAQCAWPADYQLHFPTRAELDLSNPASVSAYLKERRFDAIINSGAYTAVDRAEGEVALAWAVNALAPAIMAEAAARLDIPIVQLSTDYVFDGSKVGPYIEDDRVAPQNVYGASKEGGEQAVRTAARKHVILRTCWVVSRHGHNFVKTMLRLGAEREELRVVADQYGAPTLASDIAATVAAVVERLLNDPSCALGTFHYSSAGVATWHDVAAHIFARQAELGRKTPRLMPIPSSDYPTPARRPHNSQLSNSKIASEYGIAAERWQSGLDRVLAELSSADSAATS